MKIAAGIVLLSFPLLACQSYTGLDGTNLRVETAQEVFTLSPSSAVEVPFSIINQGSKTAYVDRCGERVMAALDRWENGDWMQHAGDICPATYSMVPVAIDPGDTLQDIRRVSEPGRYRLVLGVSENPSERSQWTVASNAFTVE